MKKIKYNEVTKVETIKEILDLAVKEAGDKDAFQYKNGRISYTKMEGIT